MSSSGRNCNTVDPAFRFHRPSSYFLPQAKHLKSIWGAAGVGEMSSLLLPPHFCNTGTEHIKFSPVRELLLTASAKRHEVLSGSVAGGGRGGGSG